MPDPQAESRRQLPSDEALAQALRRLGRAPGDEGAWRVVVTALWPYAMAVSFRETRGREDLADDVTVEAFARAARAARLGGLLVGLRSPASFRAYLRVLCRNEARRALAREARRPETSLEELEWEGGRGMVSPEVAEDRVVIEETLATILAALSNADRQLLLWAAAGHPLGEMARRAGISYGAAGVRLHRLRVRVRKILEDNELYDDGGGRHGDRPDAR
jgi:RNA polymerase sigma factor (sigma-70 family)